MSIEEGNKLIAEFMGFGITNSCARYNRIVHQIYKDLVSMYKGQIYYGDGLDYVEDLPFHSSWDWLMSAVEKIGALGYEVDICSGEVTIYKRSIFAYDVGSHNKYEYYSSDWDQSRLKTLYQEVLKFIKYYNENNSSLQP